MDRANIEKINKIISLFKSDKNIELELKYNEIISKDTYEKIIDIYKNKGLKYEEKTTLDIIFENNNKKYKITLDQKNIDNYDKTNKITPKMIKDFLNKEQVNDYKSLIINNFKFNIKYEYQITDDNLIKNLLKNLSTVEKNFRLKNRISFKSNDGLYMYDFTIVNNFTSNKTF